MTDETTELSPLKRAFLAVQSLQGKVAELEAARSEPIAIVGLSCRFPGAPDPERYWDLLRDGVDAISARPLGRWESGSAASADDDSPAIRWGGYLPAVDTFDPQFFGIAPREATGMDPQQRLFLEVCWEALENAGIAPDRLKGSLTGVFVGVCTNDYSNMQTRGGDLSHLGTHYASGIAHSIIPGRVSYLLGLSGPSISVDTACSSSLVAVHLACQALRTGDCDMAIAGGVNVILLPDNAVAFARTGMMAVDGRCKPFDASADGFVRGEGSGVVVLKRLSKAVADGDMIHALIRGSAVNQDGASSGMTAPSGPAQENVIRAALRAARVEPAAVRYVETHGTGTVLGDPIEAQAIGAALGAGRSADEKVLIGSVKSNLGHLEASAGIAGLIKVVLSLRHGAIPASLHLRTPNPLIPWDRLSVRVSTELTPWAASGSPRVAGVSSFGFGGTNAHVILSDAPAAEVSPASAVERSRHLLTWSAPTDTGLRALASSYAEHIASHPDQSLADIAHTANVGRARFRRRAAFSFAPDDDVAARLAAFARGGDEEGVVAGESQGGDGPRVVFLFSGQGSQYAGMGRTLYETQPTFRRVVDECDALLRGEVQPGVLDVLYPAAGASALLDQTMYTQPALFVLEYALATLWQSWGVKPSAVMGHSLGEFVAATVSGVLRLEDALRLVTVRGRLGQRLPPTGAMAAVLTNAARVREVIAARGDAVTIAAINSPENTVISGPHDAMAAVIGVFRGDGVEVKPLAISNAFHSPAIEPMLAEFEAVASEISYGTQRVPVFSNLHGRRAHAGEMSNAAYWTRHLREPVEFAAGFAAAMAEGYTTFLETGPHTILLGLGRQCFPDSPGAWLPSLRRGYDDWTILLGSLARLHVAGVPIDWRAFDHDYSRRRVALPTYPFQRQRYWAKPGQVSANAERSARRLHPLLARRITSPFIDSRVFETELSLASTRWLSDHRVLGAAVLPTTAYLETAWAAATALHGDAVDAIEQIDIYDALVTPEEGSTTMQLSVAAPDEQSASFRVVSADGSASNGDQPWRSHASGSISLKRKAPAGASIDLDGVRARCTRTIAAERIYETLIARGIDLGSAFHGLVEVAQGSGEAIGKVQAPEELSAELASYHAHPALLDAALQVVAAALFDDAGLGAASETFMPVAVDRFRIVGEVRGTLWSHAVARPRTSNASPVADIRLYDDHGVLVAEIEGLHVRRVETAAWAGESRESVDGDLYETVWRIAEPQANPETVAAHWIAPAPSAIAESIAPHVAELAATHRLAAYGEQLPALDTLCRYFIVEALTALGWRPAVGTRVDAAALADELGIVDAHRRLFDRLLAILVEDGLLARNGNEISVIKGLVAPPTAERLAALRVAFPEASAELGLLARTGPRLAELLAGRADPLALLFPGGRFDEADELYRRSPTALTLNGLARRAVQAVVAASPADAPLRVLEIGAGTGGTSSFVLPVLPADRTRYLYTDLSPLFLARAEERMGRDFPFVDYKILDIEHDPATQDLGSDSFDVVIAANVLHATRDLGETLAHVRQLVRPGGTLLLLEGTRPQRWIDLTFGLTNGWWRFTDRDLRPDYPLIGRSEWAQALAAAGFEATTAIPSQSADEVLEQNLLIVSRAPSAERAQWIILADEGGAGDAIAAELTGHGQHVVFVRAGQAFAREGSTFVIPPTEPSAYQRLVAEIARDAPAPVAGVVHCWSLDARPGSAASAAELHAAEVRGARSALHLAQALASADATASSRLAFVTRGAQAVVDDDVSEPVHALMWGLARTIRLEHPALDCLCVDLDASAPTDGRAIAMRILSRGEPQLAVRNDAWFAPRLVRLNRGDARPSAAKREDRNASVKLVNATPGVLDGLTFVADPRRAPAMDEVEIEITAAALNFRDVLIAMGLYPGASAGDQLGGECAGTITRVGAGVTALAVGDPVIAMAPGALGSHVIAHQALVLPQPAALTAEQAVTLPSVFMTAWHSLYDLARLKAGERVLIHAGAGGVGLAAIQLARRVGARIFATAGSAEKRAYLTSLGVEHVMDSRSLNYGDEIARLTNGAGVDVVLNSLADEHIGRSFGALAADGRFIELGKRGIWTEEQARALRPGVKYFVVDLAATGTDRPDTVGAVLRRVYGAADAGEITPLPATVFESNDVVSAFRFMAQARHIGKIVIKRPHAADPSRVRADGTYLVTGGLGGLGLVTARWLVERGAGHVVLMGRGEPDEETQNTLDGWNRHGARVSFFRGDVGNERDVARVLAYVGAERAPLRGVIHSAGVLDDRVIVGQTWERFTSPFGPKVDGTWHLHRATERLALDFFVLFSSISAVFGSPGQGNHAAANAFMDALAHQRRARGLPALSINWGAWEEVGAALKHNVAGRIGAQGMGTISPAGGVAAMERLMEENPPQAAVMPVDWSQFARQFSNGSLRASFLSELASSSLRSEATPRAAAPRVTSDAPATRGAEVPVREAPPATRWGLLLDRMRKLAARVLGLDSAMSLDTSRPLQEMGLDSLMAVEFRNLLKTELGLERAVSATIVFDYPTVDALTEYVGCTLFGWPSQKAAPAPKAAPVETDLLDSLESLSSAEAEQLLASRIGGGR